MDKQPTFALLIIDVINSFDFEHGDQLVQHAHRIANPILKLKARCFNQDIPIIYINDHYDLWQANIEKIYQSCENEKSKAFLHLLRPNSHDFFLIKPKHSAFYGTALHTLLHKLKVNSLIITGLAGNICVLFTANDAYMREFSLYVPKDCVASANEEDNQYALEMMRNVLKANTTPSPSLFNKHS
ncbi:isochorismatase family cysteine hydrolase [Bacillus spongiae]|uniref:Isochorismatase family cysteine hydrolase n=1 Tax=Bacillus spongiae TaxID=2683610 RepID=A0ABU8HKA5_9BACI